MIHKVLSLLQPWAQLVVTGNKIIETRSWNTSYRGELLIHASATPIKIKEHPLLFLQKAQEVNCLHKDLPLGAIIGKVELLDVYRTAGSTKGSFSMNPRASQRMKSVKWEAEKLFGDYSPNRYCWVFTKPVLFKEPISAKGKLSQWDWEGEIPD